MPAYTSATLAQRLNGSFLWLLLTRLHSNANQQVLHMLARRNKTRPPVEALADAPKAAGEAL